jgi:hypothetical protein
MIETRNLRSISKLFQYAFRKLSPLLKIEMRRYPKFFFALLIGIILVLYTTERILKDVKNLPVMEGFERQNSTFTGPFLELLNIMQVNVSTKDGNKIFFIDTLHVMNNSAQVVGPRQLCSFESAGNECHI